MFTAFKTKTKTTIEYDKYANNPTWEEATATLITSPAATEMQCHIIDDDKSINFKACMFFDKQSKTVYITKIQGNHVGMIPEYDHVINVESLREDANDRRSDEWGTYGTKLNTIKMIHDMIVFSHGPWKLKIYNEARDGVLVLT